MSKKQAFINGHVITMDSDLNEVEALGVSGTTLAVVGSNAEVLAWAGDEADVVDLGGKTVIPGLIESHNHISIGSIWESYANCSSVVCATIEDVLDAISSRLEGKAAGEWVQGFGYDDTAIAEMRHLTRHDLDAISAEHPIFISHVSGHLTYLNTLALEMASIDSDTPDPQGGTIHHEEDGNPSGLLLETAAFAVRAILPMPSREEYKDLFVKQIAKYNSYGLTGTHDAAIGLGGSGETFFGVCRELEAAGEMNMRIYTAVLDEAYEQYAALGVARGYGSDYCRVGGVKYFQDGSIQGFTGWLLEDYHTRPGHRSQSIHTQEHLNERFVHHQKNGDHIVVHCNGDAAIESVIQAMELAQEKHPREDTRHMLIHCQMAHDHHIDRMKALGVIPSYFINHVYYWGDRHRDIFMGPERATRIDPLGTSLRKGLKSVMHCDFPITPIDPWFTMHTAVNRLTRSGQVLGADERISPLQTLRAFTIDTAWCSFEEDIKGSLEVGKLADFAVCSDNMLTCDPLTIKDIKVLRTVIGGRTVHEVA
ncbi:MAG: amidohydrolase [Candidatus Promineifilaceae bacterium]